VSINRHDEGIGFDVRCSAVQYVLHSLKLEFDATGEGEPHVSSFPAWSGNVTGPL